MVLSALPT